MANDLTKNPWFVDTASGTNLTDNEVVLSKIECVGDASTSGDAAIVANGTGRTITRFRANGANFKDEVMFAAGPGIASARHTGLRVPTLTTGMQLYIHFL